MQSYGQQNDKPGMSATAQLMGAQPQALMDTTKLAALETQPEVRRQEIGNAIYPIIQQNYGNNASKITGMLLDNEQVVDPVKLVSDVNYLNQKAHEAFSLLQENFQQTPDQAQAPQQTN